MSAIDLCVFLTSYSLVVAFAAIVDLLLLRRNSSLANVVIALIVVSATTVVGYYVKPGTSYPGVLWFLFEERDFSAVVSAAFGVAVALIWLARLADQGRFADRDRRGLPSPSIVGQWVGAASLVGVVLCCQAFVWKEIRGVQRDPQVRMEVPEFVIEKVAHIDFFPIRIAAAENGRIYLTYDYFQNTGTIGGGVMELSPDPATGKFDRKIVADSPLLLRCYGLAVRDGELFVSRAGIAPAASSGKVTYANTGAVTRLRDVDGDGYFEYADDVVTGLPGVRGPSTMHQNNGIAFAADGSLFVTTASAGDRTPSEQPWEGVILKTDPAFTQTDVFARGFRNPFGIVIGPDNELFATDNDVDGNPGDELNHIVEGAHYGHPYVVASESSVVSSGFRDPILVGEVESNLLGMAYATSSSLPAPYRNCIYVADFMKSAILRIQLEKSGDTYRVSDVSRFATVSSPIDITVTAAGEFFLISRNTQNVYRIRLREKRSGGSDE
jgi:sugar lactone lactonase YvrE